MFLKELHLNQYKNFEMENFHFQKPINCFVGPNGRGKSNILDAIYHLAYGKGYFNPQAVQNIQFQKDFFVLEGLFESSRGEEKIHCSLKKGHKKTIKYNGKTYRQITEHIGKIPVVMISPADRDLITEGSAIRRKFMDGILSQTTPGYLDQLLVYNKILSQRNALLKYFAVNRTFDPDTLEVYNEQMDGLGADIFQARQKFIKEFQPIFEKHYKRISAGEERAEIYYNSQLTEGSLEELFTENLSRDRSLQYSSVGIHKDDLSFLMNGENIKKFGSQGQQKTFLIAIKLTQFECLKQATQTPPIILLDDAFDKLDQNRVSQIIGLMKDEAFSQIFISDTHKERTLEALQGANMPYDIFEL
ncbi:MAG: DNA replication/repair protein RecF [Flavobacteriaceae bacterium]